jgi:hypothetical protein
MVGFCVHGDELSGPIAAVNFLWLFSNHEEFIVCWVVSFCPCSHTMATNIVTVSSTNLNHYLFSTVDARVLFFFARVKRANTKQNVNTVVD